MESDRTNCNLVTVHHGKAGAKTGTGWVAAASVQTSDFTCEVLLSLNRADFRSNCFDAHSSGTFDTSLEHGLFAMALQAGGAYGYEDNGLDLHNEEFADDNDGWGVDSDVYTTTLNTSQLTKEQIEMAIMLEKEIMSESNPNYGGYEYQDEPAYYGNGGSAPEPDALPNSTEEALRLLAQRKNQPQQRQQAPQRQRAPQRQQAQRGQQRRPQQPKRQFGTAQDEIRAYHELCKQYRGVQAKLSSVGEPTPAQKKKFLQNLTRGLIGCLRYPVPEVRKAISAMFLNIGWDVRRNRSPPSVRRPPTGAMLKELLAKTVRRFVRALVVLTHLCCLPAAPAVVPRARKFTLSACAGGLHSAVLSRLIWSVTHAAAFHRRTTLNVLHVFNCGISTSIHLCSPSHTLYQACNGDGVKPNPCVARS